MTTVFFKHEDVQKMRDLNEEDPLEIEATAII